MSESEFPWPVAGTSFFSQAEADWWNNACLGWSTNQWIGYTEGYRRATELLLKHVLSDHRDHDTLVYPIIFNARHYLETKLKALTIAASQLIDRPFIPKPKHPLVSTWEVLRPLLEEVFAGHDRGELEVVERLVTEFDSRDRSSMVFRYPEDAKGQAYHGAPARIDLAAFRTTFQQVSAFLEACDSAIQEYSDYKNEMLRDFDIGSA